MFAFNQEIHSHHVMRTKDPLWMEFVGLAVHFSVFTLKLHNPAFFLPGWVSLHQKCAFFSPQPRGDGVQIKVTPLLVFQAAKLTGEWRLERVLQALSSWCFHSEETSRFHLSGSYIKLCFSVSWQVIEAHPRNMVSSIHHNSKQPTLERPLVVCLH